MFPVPPSILGDGNYRTLATTNFKVSEITCDKLTSTEIFSDEITTNKLNYNNDTPIVNYTIYSGVGSIVGNDTIGKVTFDVNILGPDQVRIFFNVVYDTPPIVMITQTNTYIGTITDGNVNYFAPIPFYANATTDYFTISLPNSFYVGISPGNVTINYMVIGVSV